MLAHPVLFWWLVGFVVGAGAGASFVMRGPAWKSGMLGEALFVGGCGFVWSGFAAALTFAVHG